MNFNIIGYLLYASVMSITPGPNNLMLFSYGKAYGITESRNILLGIFFGFTVMLYLAGYGIANIITSSRTAEMILKISGSAWMLYLAFVLRKISIKNKAEKKVMLGFGQAFAMQFVNVKAWVMAITGASAFMPQFTNIHLNVFIFVFTFAVVGVPSMFIWLKMGDLIARVIRSERSNRILGYVMFSLMTVTVILIWV
jgi:threonine/homoserine/homoserine lactone efflux protein